MTKHPQLKDIPVRPHVKAFLIGEFGAEPITAHSKNSVGSLVVLVAQKLPYDLVAPKPTPKLCHIQIKLPLSLKYYKITPLKATHLGFAFEKLFQTALIQFVKGQVALTDNELHAIKSFYAIYDINPDDYDVELARKCWRDYKESEYKRQARESDKSLAAWENKFNPTKPGKK